MCVCPKLEGGGLDGWQSFADMIRRRRHRLSGEGGQEFWHCLSISCWLPALWSAVWCVTGSNQDRIQYTNTKTQTNTKTNRTQRIYHVSNLPFLGFDNCSHFFICWSPKRGRWWQRRSFLFSWNSARLPSLLPSSASHPSSGFCSSKGPTHHSSTVYGSAWKIPKTFKPTHRSPSFAQPQAQGWCQEEISQETWS